jgi:hypothetical protein
LLQPSPLKQNLILRFERRKCSKGTANSRTFPHYGSMKSGWREWRKSSLSHVASSVVWLLHWILKTWLSYALWHDSFDSRSWSDAWDRSNLPRAVLLPAILYPRVPSSTSSTATCGRCRELLLTTVITPTCMPRFHLLKYGKCSDVARC